MPDQRRHRSPNPADRRLFNESNHELLKGAATEIRWLMDRGYPMGSALRFVGDHHQLRKRQRDALMRACSTADQATARKENTIPVKGAKLYVDGFNVLVTIEAALSGGVILRCMDGRPRDLSSVHGSYRLIDETERAIDLVSEQLAEAEEVTWFLDRPVSNSGRLAGLLRNKGFQVNVIDRVDRTLRHGSLPVATADGPLLDKVSQSVDLVSPILDGLEDVWAVDLQAG